MDIGTIVEGIELADVIITAICGSGIVSEVLPYIKKVRANTSHQLCWNVLRTIARIFAGNKKDKQYLD